MLFTFVWEILNHPTEEINFSHKSILKLPSILSVLNEMSLLTGVVHKTLGSTNAILFLKNHSKEERKLMPVNRSGEL